MRYTYPDNGQPSDALPQKAADESGSFAHTDNLDAVTEVMFAAGYTTMEDAMEASVSWRDVDQTIELELGDRP